nr:hypothetical protein [Hyphomonas sp. Mor2]
MVDQLRTLYSAIENAARRSPVQTFGGVMAVCLLVTGIGVYTLPGIAELQMLADRANPYFVPEHAAYLYLWVPLVTIAACISALAPGLLISLGRNKGADSFGVWVLKGFALSTFIVSLMAAMLQGVLGGPVTGLTFFFGLAFLTVACFAYVFRQDRRARLDWTFLQGRAPEILLALMLPVLTLLILSPKFYWEDFNGDGAHLYLASLQYLQSGSPFWASGTGDELSSLPTLNAVLQFFYSSWFMRLFGETAFALRMVYLLGAMVVAITVMELVRFRGQLAAPWRVAGAVGAALLLFGYTLAFNTSYDPYFADIALPLAREPFIIVNFIGFALFGLLKRPVWMAVFGVLSYASGPNGLILMGLWTGSLFLVSSRFWPINVATIKSWPIKEFVLALGIIALVAVGYSLLEGMLTGFGLASFGSEFGSAAILERLRYISIDSWQRFAFWILPCGILPVLALLFWRWQDQISRAMTLTCLFYFGFFYLQGFRILPHHFAPIMVLPLIVLWRLNPSIERMKTTILPAGAVMGCVIAAVLVTPQTLQIHRTGSQLATKIELQDVRAHPVDIEAYTAFDALFGQAFPRRFSESSWRDGYFGAPIAWYVHALQPQAGDATTNYVVRRPGGVAGSDETLIAEWEGWTVTTLSTEQYIADRDRAGIPSSIAENLYVSRDTIFGRGERWGNRRVFDLAKRLGQSDTDAEDNANEGQ